MVRQSFWFRSLWSRNGRPNGRLFVASLQLVVAVVKKMVGEMVSGRQGAPNRPLKMVVVRKHLNKWSKKDRPQKWPKWSRLDPKKWSNNGQTLVGRCPTSKNGQKIALRP